MQPRPMPLAALALIVACDGGTPEPGPPVVVTDSAGVTLVRNRRASPPRPEVHLGDPPLLRLGSEVERAPDFFGRINSAHLDPRGNLWVVDITTAEMKVFSLPGGAHLFTLGGAGEGPGEFRMPFPIGFDEGRAWIWDQNLGRLTVITLDGDPLDTRLIGTDRELVPRILARTPRGTFVAQLPELFTGAISDGMTVQDTVRLWELEDGAANARLLARRRGATWYFAERMQLPVPFAFGSRFAVGPGWLVLSDPDGRPSLDVVRDGELVRRIRVERERTPVTRDATETELDSPTRSEPARALLREHLDRLPIPDFVPAWGWVRVGRSGHVFALRYGTLLAGEVWDVFHPDGTLLGSLSLSDEAHLMDADERHVVVAEMPELSGPGVAIYKFPEEWAR